MASKLQCEICGGKLVGKPGGIFECENCGTEYSTEWAKAKIQEITGTVKVEGTVQVQGTVKVENGGPSAESLVKRGMMALEDLSSDSHGSSYDQKKKEIKELFDRALEIEPENGDAYWGLFLLGRDWHSTEDAINNAKVLWDLPDESEYARARCNAEGETLEAIRAFEVAWKSTKPSDRLPPKMQNAFRIRNGVLEKHDESCTHFSGSTAVIPTSVTEIADSAFEACTRLMNVAISESVIRIGECAFRGCTGLTSVTLPASVIEIGGSAFSCCTGLKNLVVQEGVTKIGSWAFKNCTGLTSVTLPASVTRIGRFAFSGCKELTIRVWAGSAAEQYAKNEGIPFERLKTAEELAAEEESRKAAVEKAEAEQKAAAEQAKTERIAAAERAEAERKAKIADLKKEKADLQAELPTIKGLLSGGKRRQIEARLAEIEAELKKLG